MSTRLIKGTLPAACLHIFGDMMKLRGTVTLLSALMKTIKTATFLRDSRSWVVAVAVGYAAWKSCVRVWNIYLTVGPGNIIFKVFLNVWREAERINVCMYWSNTVHYIQIFIGPTVKGTRSETLSITWALYAKTVHTGCWLEIEQQDLCNKSAEQKEKIGSFQKEQLCCHLKHQHIPSDTKPTERLHTYTIWQTDRVSTVRPKHCPIRSLVSGQISGHAGPEWCQYRFTDVCAFHVGVLLTLHTHQGFLVLLHIGFFFSFLFFSFFFSLLYIALLPLLWNDMQDMHHVYRGYGVQNVDYIYSIYKSLKCNMCTVCVLWDVYFLVLEHIFVTHHVLGEHLTRAIEEINLWRHSGPFALLRF